MEHPIDLFLSNLSTELKNQQNTLTDIQQSQKTGKEDVQVLMAEFLVKAANESIQMENDVNQALRLTALADQELANLNDAKVYPIREALSAGSAALKNVTPLDVPGVYLKLATVSQQIEKLPLINQFENNQNKNKSQTIDANLPWWKRGLQSTANALQQIVIVRKNRLNVPPFIAPEQRDYFYQNLQMEVAHAQWALLHHEEKIYQASLQQMVTWIKQFAVPSQPVTAQLLSDIASLQTINVQPELPNLSHSLEAFQQYHANQG